MRAIFHSGRPLYTQDAPCEANAGGLCFEFIRFFELFTDLREFCLPLKREVQVLGTTIAPEVAAFERVTAFEYEQVIEFARTQSD